jgi:glutaminyl-peptide cyclotransferase
VSRGHEAAAFGEMRKGLIATLAFLAWAGAVGLTSCSEAETPEGIDVYTYEVVNIFPHDPAAWTQGLAYYDGFLYESTGLFGRSTLRRVRLEDGEVLQQRNLAQEYFAEGIAVWGDRVVQLTWFARRGFVYDRETFAPREEFTYASQGWGLTHDGKRFIMSDGSAMLRFLHPETYKEIGRVEVCDEEGPVSELNELEYVEGYVYANVYPTDRAARIDPSTGRVTAWLELEGLPKHGGFKPGEYQPLNGIAYDAEGGRLFVTGKFWPRLFEIRVVPPD